MKNNVNFAIVGFGGIGKTHAIGAYTANLKLNLPYTLVVKTVVTRTTLQGKIPGVNNELGMEKVLQDEEIDFIDICTPNDVHTEMIEKAVACNKAIYCEKPLAVTYEDALQSTNLVKEKGIKNAVALIYRFMPAIRLLKKEIEEQGIGEIIDFKIKLYHKSYLDENKRETWRTKKTSGGGALLDLGIHLIDAVYFTLGEIEKTKCNTSIFFKDRSYVDEIANCTLTLKDGTKGSLEVSRVFAEAEEPTTYVVYGSKGSIKMSSGKPYTIEVYHYETNSTEIKSAKGVGSILKCYPSERDSLGFHMDCHMKSIVNFANVIVQGEIEENLTPTFEDALRAQRVIEACYRSAISEKEIRVDEIK